MIKVLIKEYREGDLAVKNHRGHLSLYNYIQI